MKAFLKDLKANIKVQWKILKLLEKAHGNFQENRRPWKSKDLFKALFTKKLNDFFLI